MLKLRGSGSLGRTSLMAMVAALIVLATSVISYAQLDCTGCHGTAGDYRPLDATHRNFTTGGFKGNHRTHMSASATATTCAVCHNNSNYTASHRSGTISFNANIHTSPTAGTYSKGQSFAQAPDPVLGNCSNVNCHFLNDTPLWGSPKYQYTDASNNDCNGCHGQVASSYSAPQDGSHPGTGSKHGVYYGTDTASCAKCHANHVTFAHATSAGNQGRGLILNGTDMNSSNYSLPANLVYPAYMTNPVGSRNGNCTNLYCHSDGTKTTGFTANQTPTWGGTGSCILCHKLDVASGAAITTPAAGYGHGKHVNPSIAAAIGCVKCHAVTVSNNMTISSQADHVDNKVTIKFNNSTTAVNGTYNGNNASTAAYKKDVNTAAGACLNIYCHSNGTSASTFVTMSTARWGQALGANCTGCHGGDKTRSAARQMATGKHGKHILGGATNYSYGCTDCHNATVSGNTTIANPAKHVDYQVSVDFSGTYGGSYSANNHKPGLAAGNCLTVYCHSNGSASPTYVTQAWTGTLNCTGCHGDATSAGASLVGLSGRHDKHVNNASYLGTNFGCVDCHATTVTNNTTVSATGLLKHVNKMRDYSGVRAGKNASCANFYCHSNGKIGTGVVAYATPPAWTAAAAPLACNSCHGINGGGFTSKAGEPNYASGTAGTVTANSHEKHVGSSADCVKCHAKTTNNGLNILAGSPEHIDGNVDARFSKVSTFTSFSGAYIKATKSCSATYCHSGAAPVWGANGTLNCASCHKAEGTLPGKHNQHWESATVATSYSATPGNSSTANQYQFQCSSCHGLSSSNHASGPVSSAQSGQIFFGFTSANRKGAYTPGGISTADASLSWTNGSCANTYCHSNGNGSAGKNTTFTWAATSPALGCADCHGGDWKSTGSIATGYHTQHISNRAGLGRNLGCVDCHATTVSNNLTIANKSLHINKLKNYSGASAGKISSGTCSTVYCHSSGQVAPNFRTLPSWNVAGTTYDCKSCHGADAGFTSQFGEPNYANVSSVKNSWNTHTTKHIKANVDCATCHFTTVTSAFTLISSASPLHINKARNVVFDTAKAGLSASYDDVNKRCSNVTCHSNGQTTPVYVPVRWGGKLGCVGCHPTLSAGHNKHTGTLMTKIAFYEYTSNKSTGNDQAGGWSYGFGCATCHPVTPASHINNSVEVQMDSVAGGSVLRSKTSGSGLIGGVGTGTVACTNVYCHGDGKPSSTSTTQAWNTTFSSDLRCGKCHGNSPNDATHVAHVSGSIHQDDVFNGVSGKLPAGSTGSVSHGLAAQATTIGCNICHNTTVNTAANDSGSACVTCHFSLNTFGAALHGNGTIADLGAHVNGSVNVVFASANIVSKAQLRQTSFAGYTSGNAGWIRNGGNYKTGPDAFDISKSKLSDTAIWNAAAPGAGSCQNVVCHNMKPVSPAVKWNDALTCESCHLTL